MAEEGTDDLRDWVHLTFILYRMYSRLIHRHSANQPWRPGYSHMTVQYHPLSKLCINCLTVNHTASTFHSLNRAQLKSLVSTHDQCSPLPPFSLYILPPNHSAPRHSHINTLTTLARFQPFPLTPSPPNPIHSGINCSTMVTALPTDFLHTPL